MNTVNLNDKSQNYSNIYNNIVENERKLFLSNNEILNYSSIAIIKYLLIDDSQNNVPHNQNNESNNNLLNKNILNNPNKSSDNLAVPLTAELKSGLDCLKTFRGYNLPGLKPYCTKSVIDVIATIYIAYFIAHFGIEKLTNEMSDKNNFTQTIKTFLNKECGISENITNQLSNKYFKNIKYLEGTHYIKLNHFILDLNQPIAEHITEKPIVYPMKFKYEDKQTVYYPKKNQVIREYLSIDEIQQLKKVANNYKAGILKKISTIANIETKRATILKLIYFIKIVSLNQRHLCYGKLTDKELLEIANESQLFENLGIAKNDIINQLEFINQISTLSYLSHHYMKLKRYCIKLPLLILGATAIAASLVTIISNGFTSLAAIGGIIGTVALVGSGLDAMNNAGLSFGNMKTVADKLNSGDKLYSYSASVEDFFIQLLKAYDGEQASNISRSNYKQHEAWLKTPKTSDIFQYLNQNPKDTENHIKTMNNLLDSGNKIRKNYFEVTV